MKILWHILKIFSFLLLILVILVASAVVYQSIDKTDSFYLLNAEFNNYELLNQIESKFESAEDKYRILFESPNVYVHNIKHGEGTILGYRWYSSGDVGTIDDEGFEKITIWLADNPVYSSEDYILSDSNKVKVAYSRGGSSWPDYACSGYINNGNLKVQKNGSNLMVYISGYITPKGTMADISWCSNKKYELEFTASIIEHSDLNPWLGLMPEHVFNATYR